jgi:protein AbiQ
LLNFVFLTQAFYDDYFLCTEIEKKTTRPYVLVAVTIGNIDFAIPLRSNINHEYVVWTDKINKCGLDLSKSVIINDKKTYIEVNTKPYIRQIEFDNLRGKEFFIKQKLENYIESYKKSIDQGYKGKEDKTNLVMYSTLQYFHKELNITKE